MTRANPSALRRFALIFIGLVLLQLPFLAADADPGMGFSRGPYVDEGLYTAQVRNAMVTGRLDLTESDGVLKNPLFTYGAWAVLAGFGDSMVTLRLALVIVCSLALALMAAGGGRSSRMLWLAIPFGFLSYFPFHYGHLALAEIPSSVAVLGAVVLLQRRLDGARAWTLGAAAVLLLIAYALKIQFAYTAAIPPITFAAALALRWLSRLPIERRLWTDLLASVVMAALLFALYLAVWVYPNRELFSAVTSQVTGRSSSLSQIPLAIATNLFVVLRQPGVWPVSLFLLLGLVAARRAWRESTGDPQARAVWIGLLAPPLVWWLLEMHKFTLHYLPSRYFVSMLVAVSVVAASALSMRRQPLFLRGSAGRDSMGLAVLTLAMLINVGLYAKSWWVRAFDTHDTQQALRAEGRWAGKLAMGPWAPALFWGTGAITKPIWKDAYNDRDILKRFRPDAIVAEPDEGDSSQALTADGVKLPAQADKRLHIGHWSVNIYAWPPR
jgi:hypothetical protein